MSDKELGQDGLRENLERLVADLGTQVRDALDKGMEQSELLQTMAKTLEAVQERLRSLEEEVEAIRAVPVAKPATPSPVSPLPPFPGSLPSRPMPFGRSHTRSPRMRPTVTYRVDPRQPPSVPVAKFAADLPRPGVGGEDASKTSVPGGNESTAAEDASAEEGSKLCAEPGCNRPARSRGLCSAHYQRLRYRERKIELKQASSDPLPPPPPLPMPRAAQAPSRREGGGTKGVFAVLYDEKGRRLLAGLINQIKIDRLDLVQRLNTIHQGMPGIPLEEEDVLRVVHYHKLGDALRKRECDIVCRILTKQRGSLGKTAQVMKIQVEDLKTRVQELGLEDEVARIRNEFREAILEKGSFQERLDLALTREKYLEDLGIEEEVDASLRRDLDAQIAQLASGTNLEEAAQSIRQAFSLDEERYRRLLKRFGLDGGAQPGSSAPAAAENPQ